MKLNWIAAIVTVLASSSAYSQSPAMSENWLPMTLSQDQCFIRAAGVMRDAGMKRIERVAESIFADTPDGGGQALIRCVAVRQMIYVVIANRDPRTVKATDEWRDRLLSAFRNAAK